MLPKSFLMNSAAGAPNNPHELVWDPHAAESARIKYISFDLSKIPTWHGGQKAKHVWEPPPSSSSNRGGRRGGRKGGKGGKSFGRGSGWIEVEPGSARFVNLERFEGIKTMAVNEGIVISIFDNNEVVMGLSTPDKLDGFDKVRRLALARNMVSWVSVVGTGPNQDFFRNQINRAVAIMNAFAIKDASPIFIPLPAVDGDTKYSKLHMRFDRHKKLHMGFTG